MNGRKPSQTEVQEAATKLIEILTPWFDCIMKAYKDLGTALEELFMDPRVQEQIRSKPELAEFRALID